MSQNGWGGHRKREENPEVYRKSKEGHVSQAINPKNYIYLTFLIVHGYGSQLENEKLDSINVMSNSKCIPLLKCLATGDTSVLRSTMLNQ